MSVKPVGLWSLLACHTVVIKWERLLTSGYVAIMNHLSQFAWRRRRQTRRQSSASDDADDVTDVLGLCSDWVVRATSHTTWNCMVTFRTPPTCWTAVCPDHAARARTGCIIYANLCVCLRIVHGFGSVAQSVRPTSASRYCDPSRLLVGSLVGWLVRSLMCTFVSSHAVTSCNGNWAAGEIAGDAARVWRRWCPTSAF